MLARRHSRAAGIHATAVLCDETAVYLRSIRLDDKERLWEMSDRFITQRFGRTHGAR
jgi:hypothetical protein